MEWINWKAASVILTGVNLLLVFLIIPVIKLIQKMRYNELHHIEEKLDHLHQCVERRMDKLEEKLEDHIQYHLRERRK